MNTLVTPEDACAELRRRIDRKWAEAVCTGVNGGETVIFSVPLRPGVTTGKAVERLGYGVWHEWRMRWRDVADRLPHGVCLVHRTLSIRGVAGDFPARLVADLDGGVAFLAEFGAEPPGFWLLLIANHTTELSLVQWQSRRFALRSGRKSVPWWRCMTCVPCGPGSRLRPEPRTRLGHSVTILHA